MSKNQRLKSAKSVGKTECDRCGTELGIGVYTNGVDKCPRCYGIEKGYYKNPEAADYNSKEDENE